VTGAKWKDYRLTGDAGDATLLTEDAFEAKVERTWFSPRIDRKEFKRLIQRSDAAALRDFGLWLALLAASGIGAVATWATWWCVPFFAVYGVLYSASEHRHHELSHGTPFKTRRLNELLYHLCAFMTLREGRYYRWSHTRHHSHTSIIGKDPEVAVPRPPDLLPIVSDVFFLRDGYTQILRLARHASGRLTEEGKLFVPESERSKVFRASRVYLGVIGTVIVVCFATGSLLPAMLVVLPRFYGAPFSFLMNLALHAGLDEDVWDHRLNSRTVLVNPVLGFLYANMNYHAEHHMFPMVPYHRLPALHARIAEQCPAPYRGMWNVYREIVPTLIRQKRDPSWFARRRLPEADTIRAGAYFHS
jgi:fatty acid desaturase